MKKIYLDYLVDSQALFKLAQMFAYEEGTCLFYSGTTYETAQHSFLFLFPYEFIEINQKTQTRKSFHQPPLKIENENLWEAMQILGEDIGKGEGNFPEWVGFFGYEMGAFSDQDIVIPHLSAKTPEAYWQRCMITLKINQKTGQTQIQVIDDEKIRGSHPKKDIIEQLSTMEGWNSLVEEEKFSSFHNQPLSLGSSSDTKHTYIEKIHKAKEFIKQGDVYQINLSQQWEFLGEKDPFDLFKRLTHLNPAPFAAYFYLKAFTIISSSPERFLQKQGRILETRPIKGTAPRGKTREEDEKNREKLWKSEKENAELMMITDLMRNDLGKISVNGSVEVPLLCACEAYHNVFHLYSIVRSKVLENLHPLEIIKACFPGGSITGCPKIRAMEVIFELEQRPRGIYTGSLGYFSENGDFDFNIAIRTLVVDKEVVNVQLGGGIVSDSDPLNEFEETYHKGLSIFEILDSVY